MKIRTVCIALLATVFPAFSLCAQESEPTEKSVKADPVVSSQERMSKLIALGPGVHNILTDKDGQIVSCIIVGQSRISTALGKSKGLEVARDRAALACSAEFVKWLKEEVRVFQSVDDETILMLTGEEGGEDDELRESGKAIEKSSKKIESISQGLVRGLVVLHKEVDGIGKNYSVVKGWKAETANATKAVTENLKDGITGPNAGKKSKEKTTKPANRDKKNIDDEIATAKEADEFFKVPK